MRFVTAFLMLSVLAITTLAPEVRAHARLDQATPAPDSVVSAPAEVRIWFTQELTLSGNDIVVTDAYGNRVDNFDAAVDQADLDRKQLVTTLQPLADGAYTVTWTSTSADDGHPATESYSFSVATAAEEPVAGLCPDRAGAS